MKIFPLIAFLALLPCSYAADGEKSAYTTFRMGSGSFYFSGPARDRLNGVKELGYQETASLISAKFGAYWPKFKWGPIGIFVSIDAKILELANVGVVSTLGVIGGEYLHFFSSSYGKGLFLGGQIGLASLLDDQSQGLLNIPIGTYSGFGIAAGASVGYSFSLARNLNLAVSIDAAAAYIEGSTLGSLTLKGGFFL